MTKRGARRRGPVTVQAETLAGTCRWQGDERERHEVYVSGDIFVCRRCGFNWPRNPFKDEPEKNAAAVELGRLGGLKGGPARAEALSAERGAARWGKG